jgi:hypothetical protein
MASVPWRDALCGSEENDHDPDGKHFQSRFGIDQSARNEALCSIMDCPELPDFDPIVPAAWDAAFAGSPVLTFNQSWRAERQPGFSAGSVRIGWQRDAFCFDARLEDSCLFTTASQRNDILYLLGDTLEFFAGAAGSPAYVEYHYAPNGVILQLLWPQSARAITLPAAGGLQAFAIEENDSSHSVWPIPGGWRVCAKVRFGPLLNATGTLEGTGIDLHFGRYDSADAVTPAVLSSTASLPRCCFHDRPNWQRVVCRTRAMQGLTADQADMQEREKEARPLQRGHGA